MRWIISHIFHSTVRIQRARLCFFLSFIHSFEQFAFLSDTSVTFWVWWVTVIVSSILWPQTRNVLVITLKFVSVRRPFLELYASLVAHCVCVLLLMCVSARARPRSETVTLEIENRFYVSLSISIFYSIYFFLLLPRMCVDCLCIFVV